MRKQVTESQFHRILAGNNLISLDIWCRCRHQIDSRIARSGTVKIADGNRSITSHGECSPSRQFSRIYRMEIIRLPRHPIFRTRVSTSGSCFCHLPAVENIVAVVPAPHLEKAAVGQSSPCHSRTRFGLHTEIDRYRRISSRLVGRGTGSQHKNKRNNPGIKLFHIFSLRLNGCMKMDFSGRECRPEKRGIMDSE